MIEAHLLGDPGRDNALYLRVDAGTAVRRLLFDCGSNTVTRLPQSEIHQIDEIFFSHLHIDHVAGFDELFRRLFNRTTRPNRIWGPPLTIEIIGNRFRGFLWNLNLGEKATWQVVNVGSEQVRSARFHLGEGFATAYEEGRVERDGPVHADPVLTVEAMTMNHQTPTLAYIVRERPHVNVDTRQLQARGLPPGPWLGELKGGASEVTIGGERHDGAVLRRELLRETPGDAVAYLTDFLLDQEAMERLIPRLDGVGTIYCESQYRQADLDLARRYHHMTAKQAASLAAASGARELILFHLSDRYASSEWEGMLDEAREIFPATRFPEGW